jgi:hypothetical protein
MACATDSGTVAFYTAPALEPSYSCIELIEYHSEPQRTRRKPMTIVILLGLTHDDAYDCK